MTATDAPAGGRLGTVIVVSARSGGQLRATPAGDNRIVPGRKKRRDDDLAPYRRIRKPVPPPGRVIPDRRRKIREDEAERERRRRGEG
jgi:hypothetical protein